MSPETRETRIRGPRRRAGGVDDGHGRSVAEVTVPIVHETLRATEVIGLIKNDCAATGVARD